ncbi:Nbl1-Borealin-N domain-containing protein [Mycena sanguinolenta]|uniref:Nbl1-Borealin-N domain-containing protein n=1 Tax=Mycena sanguinolenta TaxID=230812 RepID=A0A8H7CS81_9AGAR|nr:Nbl1-Borealin-N domain-containing protein [Mycena sanguinolenta]
MFNVDEKQHLIANLEIEVNHRKLQFRSWLNDHLENFSIHQEGLVSRIPKQVRAMKMRDFGAKYNGNIQAALRGVQREKFAAAGATEIDKSTRKRKWVASQDFDASEKAAKNARLTVSPQKKPGSSTGPGTAQRARNLAAKASTLPRSFGSPSPQKFRAPFNANAATHSPRPLPRAPLSPSKLKQVSNPPPRSRVPSITTFNPMVPKTPGYPGGSMRLPRKNESMLSVNGSPIANPYDVWPGDGDAGGPTAPARTLKRTKTSITIQWDPAYNTDSSHSHTTSQSSLYQSSSSSMSSLDGNTTINAPPKPQPQPLAHPHLHHERTKSQTQFLQFKFPQMPPQTQSQSQPAHSQPTEPTAVATPAAPRPLSHTHSQSTMPITLATKDGYKLLFDALQTSPGEIDALEGISDSAKKQAREEMRMLVRAAVDKWTI